MLLREYAPSQRKTLFGEANKTRFKITATLNDGYVVWRGWFDDRDDADAFLFAQATGSLINDRGLWDLPNDTWTPQHDFINVGWRPEFYPDISYEFATQRFLTSTSASNQTDTVPSDWNSSNNTIEVIASGAGGIPADGTYGGGVGGGGGGYSKATNVSLTPGGSVTFFLQAGGATSTSGSNCWYNGATIGASSVGATGGSAGTQSTGAGGAGGTVSVGSGYSGGAGGTRPSTPNGGTGGGGAGGPGGTGAAGGASANAGGGGGGNGGGSAGSAASTNTGGAGGNAASTDGNGTGGAAGTSTVAGQNGGAGAGGGAGSSNTTGGKDAGNGTAGTYWDSTHGASGGGGGGGGGASVSGNAGTAGYGGGGGGAGWGGSSGTAAAGGQGLIAITYSPFFNLKFNMPNLGM